MGIGSVLACSELRSCWLCLCRSGSPSLRQAGGWTSKSDTCRVVIPLSHIYVGLVALVEAFYSRPPFQELHDGLTIGRRLLPSEFPSQITKVFDLTCEFPEPPQIRRKVFYRCLPTLDARSPTVAVLRQVAREVLNAGGGVYIHCANGHGRTGAVAGAVLLVGGKARTSRKAIEYLRQCRPKLTLNSTQRFALRELEASIAQEDEEVRSHSTMEPKG